MHAPIRGRLDGRHSSVPRKGRAACNTSYDCFFGLLEVSTGHRVGGQLRRVVSGLEARGQAGAHLRRHATAAAAAAAAELEVAVAQLGAPRWIKHTVNSQRGEGAAAAGWSVASGATCSPVAAERLLVTRTSRRRPCSTSVSWAAPPLSPALQAWLDDTTLVSLARSQPNLIMQRQFTKVLRLLCGSSSRKLRRQRLAAARAATAWASRKSKCGGLYRGAQLLKIEHPVGIEHVLEKQPVAVASHY